MRFLLALLLLSAAAPALADTGQDQFNDSCSGCHTVDGTSFTAPSLKGVVGRQIAALPDFQYSAGLKDKRGIWTEAALNEFLTNPSAFAPGTTMTVSVPDAATRQAIIDYLKTVK